MHGVKLLSLMLRNLKHLHGQDAKAVLLELLNNVANGITAHGVRLNDSKSTLQSFHKFSLLMSLLFFATFAAFLCDLCGFSLRPLRLFFATFAAFLCDLCD